MGIESEWPRQTDIRRAGEKSQGRETRDEGGEGRIKAWHITHRCHKREFLLKFARDRQRWLELRVSSWRMLPVTR